MKKMTLPSLFLYLSTFHVALTAAIIGSHAAINIGEATIDDIQEALHSGTLTSRKLVEHYLKRTETLNPLLKAVIELNPDALGEADKADRERSEGRRKCAGLHGIPILLKDNIATEDRLNTTAGSFALLGSVVARDSGVARKLRRAGAVIFGKAGMSEWATSGLSRPPTDGVPEVAKVRPICRTVSDAVHVLEAIVGFDERDREATKAASRYIPRGGYRQFLKKNGLKGKRVGILRKGFFDSLDSVQSNAFEEHFDTMRQEGAIMVDDLEIDNVKNILDYIKSGESVALVAEFKISLNAYLSELLYSPVRSLLDVINFNNKHDIQERTTEFGQFVFLAAENTSGLGAAEQKAVAGMARLSEAGLEKLMVEKKLDAVVTPDSSASPVLAIGGYPGISVPAGYGREGEPFGICFGGLKGSEPKLIEIAFSFEQATEIRKPPTLEYTDAYTSGLGY